MKFIWFYLFGLCIICSCYKTKELSIESENFEWVEMADGVYACIHKLGGKAICNVGVVDNGKETIIFDSFLSPEVAEELKLAIEKSSLSPIKYVINSHFHNDHIRGNQVFDDDVKIISTLKTKELIEKWEPINFKEEKEIAPLRFAYYDSLYQNFEGDTSSTEFQKLLLWRPYYATLSESYKEVQTRLPDQFIESLENLDGPNRKVQLVSKGAGHTEGDLIMYLPDDEILFSGDLLFHKRHPWLSDGSLSGWNEWLTFMEAQYIDQIVPGHGPIGSKEVVTQMSEYLLSMVDLANEMRSEQLPLDSISSVEIPDSYASWGFDRFFIPNLTFSYEMNSK